jgi:dTDP-glucose 4,6-dehydratase
MAMTILVTGGAGFIGSNFVRFMLREHPEYRVVNLDMLTYAGNLENLEGFDQHPSYRFVKGDVVDGDLVRSVMDKQKVDAVVNFAAESHVDRSILGASEFVRTNVVGVNVMLEALKERPTVRFVQVSTDEVYGSLGETGSFSEVSPVRPSSPYAASKAAADVLVQSYHRTFGLEVIISRCSNNYGPYQFPEKLIPLMIANAIEGKPLPVYGDGLNVRDWIHVEDHCEALDLILHRGKSGEVYNIGGSGERTNLDVVRGILKHLGKPESSVTFVKDRPGHDRRYAIDATKLKRELDWQPRHTFEDGLAETIEWYVNHESWWRRIISGEYQHYYRKMYEER